VSSDQLGDLCTNAPTEATRWRPPLRHAPCWNSGRQSAPPPGC